MPDLPDGNPSNTVMRAAIQAFADAPSNESRAAMMDQVLSGTLLLAVRSRSGGALPPQFTEEQAQILTTNTPDGSAALIAFTDAESVSARAGEGVQVVAERGDAVIRRALDGGYNALVINPAGPWAYITRPEMQRLLIAASE